MSTRFSYKTKGHLSQKELEGLHKLCREEEDVKWATLNSDKELSDYYHKLLVYFRVNKFKLFEANETLLDRYKEYKDKYDFIIAKDKKNNLLGYICFEHLKLDTDEEIKDLIIIKHMYISNAASHTNLDNVLFWVLENIVEKCVIYSDKLYRVCNEFNGYSLIKDPFALRATKAIRIKKKYRIPQFINLDLTSIVNTMGSFELYKNLDRL